MKVMIVDDSDLMRKVLKNYMSKKDETIEIVKAADGKEAINMFKEENPDLTFMDMVMPNMTGVEVIKEIIKINPNAKIIAVSSEIEYEQPSIEAGAKTFLKKPLASQIVYDAVDKVLN